MSISTEPRTLPPDRLASRRASAPSTAAESQGAKRLYRVIWRWHFYAGLFVAPVIIVMAATGALYIFKDELESIFHARLLFVAPSETRATLDDQLAAARAGLPNGYRLGQMSVYADPARSTEIYASNGVEYRRVLVDPYRGKLLGVLGPNDIFPVVLKIHRSLFAGTPGRIVTELVTCWTIVLLVTGAYLWWPRKPGKAWGAWLPRLFRHPYVALRDLHAVSGAYVAVIALLVASTGLLYTYVWGQGYRYAALRSGAYDIYVNPPQSRSPADSPRLPMEDILAAAKQELPGATLSIRPPETPRGAYIVFASSPMGASSDAVAIIDHATGEVLSHRTKAQYPALAWWANWNYPLHVGSVLGMWTKVPWLLTCVVLMLLPVTGVWMWWQRRPRGRTGFPRKPQVRVPGGLVVGIVALACVLPVLGLSIAVIFVGETLLALWRRIRPAPAAGT